LLIALIYLQVRPVQLVDIKVPVATDKAEYYPGQEVGGIFFGEVFWDGKVEIHREVYCKNYKATIQTDAGDDIFRGVSRPIKLEGTSRVIGKLPLTVPIGENCVIQFVNTYHLNTPFGGRDIDVTYYTQNFKILTQEDFNKRQQEVQPAAEQQRQEYGEDQIRNNTDSQNPVMQEQKQAPPAEDSQSSLPASGEQEEAGASSVVSPPSAPAEPIAPPEPPCTIGLLGICIRL
jgi:hypothetical protein